MRDLMARFSNMIVDTNFNTHMIPLRRSAVPGLMIETAVRYAALKYTIWALQAVHCLQKLVSLVHRSVNDDDSSYLVFHSVYVNQVVMECLCSTAFVCKAEKMKEYFNFLRFLCHKLMGKSAHKFGAL